MGLVVASGFGGFGTGDRDVSGWRARLAHDGKPDELMLSARVLGEVYPGRSNAVSFAAENPGPSPVHLSSVRLDWVSADTAHPGCNASEFSMNAVAENVEVPPNAGRYELPNVGTFVDHSINRQDACRGTTLTLFIFST